MYLMYVKFNNYALDDQTMSALFRGLTRSNSIRNMELRYNEGVDVEGIRSMLPFLQNAKKLVKLDIGSIYEVKSEGFNMLFRALHGSPIKELICGFCGIESIDIDIEHAPKHLEKLDLSCNEINADGCHELAKLLQGNDSTLKILDLHENKIDDEAVAILVGALQNNTPLTTLNLKDNNGNQDRSASLPWRTGITNQGKMLLLKLVNDISSTKTILQSNHTLQNIYLDSKGIDPVSREDIDIDQRGKEIHKHLKMATMINSMMSKNKVATGGTKVIVMELNCQKRAALADLQGVNRLSPLYSEINPLHLPEVLSLVGRHHSHSDMYGALRSSIAALISTTSRKLCLQQRIAQKRATLKAKIAEHKANLEAAQAELAAFEAEGSQNAVEVDADSRSNKRLRAA